MDIRQIESFVSVVKQGSYTKAAEDMYITRQALSKTIKNLEQEVGRPLLAVQDNHIKLTETGKSFYDDAQPVLSEYYAFKKKYNEDTASTRRVQTLSLAMSHGTNRVLPTNMIDSFRLLNSDILLTVEELTSEETAKAVEQSEAEIGLIGSVPRYLNKFDALLIVQTDLYVFVPRNTDLSKKELISYDDLDSRPFVTFGKKNHLHRYFAEECKSRGVLPDVVLTTSDTNLLIRTAVQQEAFFFGFPPSIESIEPESHVLLPLEDGDRESFGTYAIKRKNVALTTPARKFWEQLEEQAS